MPILGNSLRMFDGENVSYMMSNFGVEKNVVWLKIVVFGGKNDAV